MLTVLTLYQRGGPSVFSALCFHSSLVFRGSSQRRTVSAFELYLHWGSQLSHTVWQSILDLQEFGETLAVSPLPVWQPPFSSLVPNATIHTSFPGKGFSLLAVQLLTDWKSSESQDLESLNLGDVFSLEAQYLKIIFQKQLVFLLRSSAGRRCGKLVISKNAIVVSSNTLQVMS